MINTPIIIRRAMNIRIFTGGLLINSITKEFLFIKLSAEPTIYKIIKTRDTMQIYFNGISGLWFH